MAALIALAVWKVNRFRIRHTPRRTLKSIREGTCPRRTLRRLTAVGLRCGFTVPGQEAADRMENTFLDIYDYLTQDRLF